MSTSRLLHKKIFCILLFLAPFLVKASDGDPLEAFAKNKEMPDQYRKQILTALSYFPELQDVHIVFRIKKQYATLTTRPNFAGVFKRKDHRTYVITISNQTIDTLSRLLFENLTFDEQVGVLGHELSHVVDFNSKNFFQNMRNGLGHLSKKYLDKMEFNTDRICVMHGLGNYLEAYSSHVRQIMHVHYWRGVDFVYEKNNTHERYMNPDTIEKFMGEVKPR